VINIEAFRIKDGWKGSLPSIPIQMIDGHVSDCAVHDEGPCTCGTQEELESLVLEESELNAKDTE
jgi:hypothetical protein